MAKGKIIGVIIVLILIVLLLPIVPFSVKGTGDMQGLSSTFQISTITLSGTRSLSCALFGIGVIRVSNVSGASYLGLNLNSQFQYTGWDNYCDNAGIASGAYYTSTHSSSN